MAPNSKEVKFIMRKSSHKGRRLAAKIVASLCAYSGTLGLIGSPAEATAGSSIVEMPSSYCHAQYDNNGTTVNNSGMLTYSGTGTKSIYCPIDNRANPSDVDLVHIYGTEGTNGASSRACSCYPSLNTCSCSSAVNWSNSSGVVGTLTDTYEWNQGLETEFRFMLHTMTQNSTLAGMLVSASW